MKSLMTKVDVRIIYLVLTMAALAAAAGAPIGPLAGFAWP